MMTQYTVIQVAETEKDLGVHFTSNLKFDEHISKVVNKANIITGLKKRKLFTWMKIFYTTLLGLWEQCILSSNKRKKNKRIIENVQKRVTKLVPEIRELPYK